jgi:hypothetical protein
VGLKLGREEAVASRISEQFGPTAREATFYLMVLLVISAAILPAIYSVSRPGIAKPNKKDDYLGSEKEQLLPDVIGVTVIVPVILSVGLFFMIPRWIRKGCYCCKAKPWYLPLHESDELFVCF